MLLKGLPLILICAFSTLSARATPTTLDKIMPISVQKKTGVIKLNIRQKEALADWLEHRFNIHAEMAASNPSNLSLSESINEGQVLKLTDGTYWSVDPQDTPRSAIWFIPFPIEITPSGDPDYPYKITNQSSGDFVKAQKMTPPQGN